MSIHNNNDLVAKTEMVEAEVVEQVEPIQLTANLQFVFTPEVKAMYKIEESMQQMLQTMEKTHVETSSLLGIMNTTLYHHTQNTKRDDGSNVIELLEDLSVKMDAIAGVFASLPEWIPAHTLQESTGLSVDAIRKQLLNPKNFEPEIDYKQVGKIWHINKNAIPKVRRQK